MPGPSDSPDPNVAPLDGSPGESQRARSLPDSLRTALDAYTSALDRELPGVLTGLYLVGSVALGDYTPKLSDVDMVAVSDGEWTSAQLDVARRAHRHLSRRKHPVRVAYASFAQLAAHPSNGEAHPSNGEAHPSNGEIVCFENSTRLPAEELANPFTWHILATAAIAVRGPQHPQVTVSQAAIEQWADTQLHDHWRTWLESARHHHGTLLFRRSVAGTVLEVSRLYEAATTGMVLSKLAAGEALLPQLNTTIARVVRDATGYRQGHHTSMYWAAFERRHDALELIDELTAPAQPVA